MNVTYLLGAGASANCLPTYANFEKRFMQFALLFHSNSKEFQELKENYKNLANRFYTKAEDLVKEFRYHNTPDTIAKKYFHRYGGNSEQLKDLKELLILFFIYEQTISDYDGWTYCSALK